jgi:fatty-acyl-CoA synthase
MKGYLANEDATNETFKGGWFRTGDLGVQHPNGRIEIKDRSKDIIISGGENISSIEIESILLRHPAISEAAVIAMPDEKWGEVPCAFVTLHPNSHTISEDEIIKWARGKMAGFQTPKRIVFSELPKTSTGKVLKHELRKLLPKS